jgi:hypothetical protein
MIMQIISVNAGVHLLEIPLLVTSFTASASI